MQVFGRIAALGLLSAIMVPTAAFAEPTVIKFGMQENSMPLFQTIALHVAGEKGMFAKEDIQLDVTMLPGTYHMIEQLDEGNIDLSYTAVNDLIPGVVEGSSAVLILGGPANPIYSIIAKPEIKTVEDLKGKQIAVSLPGDIISVATRDVLGKHGVAEADYTPVVLIGSVRRLECLESGDCDAATLAQPYDMNAIGKGYNLVGTSREVIANMQYTGYAIRKEWGPDHKDELVRFVRAMGEAYKFVADPANKDEVIAIAARTTKSSPELTTQLYNFSFEANTGVLPKQGEIDVAGVAKVIELMASADAIPGDIPTAENLVDLQYLEAAGLQ